MVMLDPYIRQTLKHNDQARASIALGYPVMRCEA